MKNSTLIVLGLIGVGLYLYYKKQSAPVVADLTNLPPATPSSSLVNPDPYAPENNVKQATSTDESINFKFALSGMNRRFGKIPNTI